ncbi:phosphate acetyltransferase [Mycoplasmopsis pulmonis]|uniref:phosphate acetyltransferase n=1 Tax=Mycoplasmopsis pulmonis TaxID=2107 RepID=UPI001004FC2F|nr:phosphate acetyltransferase [Mycoplasmopsis pulmonis]VEU67997.1 phosphotransacetylase [Mycoplasmopsis pulmonis]
MNFNDYIISRVKKLKEKKRILLVDGNDPRSLEAAKELQKYPNIEVSLLVESKSDVKDGFNFVVLDQDQKQYESFCQDLFESRKGKDSLESVQKALKTRPFYAMMLLKKGFFDGVVGGLLYTTADILKAAFKVVGPKVGVKTISSLMIMSKGEDTKIFADISINVNPSADQLVDIAKNSVEFLEQMGIEAFPSFLSFSTQGSAVSDETKKVVEAKEKFNALALKAKALGEIQFDAAVDLKTRSSKYKNPEFSQESNLLIFPDLEAGNIGYKIAQRMGKYGAFGPIVTGTKLPINDLSRGASVEDVANTVLITALQSEGK